jgi:hypothetical protein
VLGKKGSLYATRPTLFTHIAQRETLEEMAADLFAVVASGAVKIPVHARAKLKEAAEVHRALEGRETTARPCFSRDHRMPGSGDPVTVAGQSPTASRAAGREQALWRPPRQ